MAAEVKFIITGEDRSGAAFSSARQNLSRFAAASREFGQRTGIGGGGGGGGGGHMHMHGGGGAGADGGMLGELKGMFGAGSTLGVFSKMAMGGGILRGVALAAREAEAVTGSMNAIATAMRNGEGATEAFIAAVHKFPIVGNLVKTVENLTEVMIGYRNEAKKATTAWRGLWHEWQTGEKIRHKLLVSQAGPEGGKRIEAAKARDDELTRIYAEMDRQDVERGRAIDARRRGTVSIRLVAADARIAELQAQAVDVRAQYAHDIAKIDKEISDKAAEEAKRREDIRRHELEREHDARVQMLKNAKESLKDQQEAVQKRRELYAKVEVAQLEAGGNTLGAAMAAAREQHREAVEGAATPRDRQLAWNLSDLAADKASREWYKEKADKDRQRRRFAIGEEFEAERERQHTRMEALRRERPKVSIPTIEGISGSFQGIAEILDVKAQADHRARMEGLQKEANEKLKAIHEKLKAFEREGLGEAA